MNITPFDVREDKRKFFFDINKVKLKYVIGSPNLEHDPIYFLWLLLINNLDWNSKWEDIKISEKNLFSLVDYDVTHLIQTLLDEGYLKLVNKKYVILKNPFI